MSSKKYSRLLKISEGAGITEELLDLPRGDWRLLLEELTLTRTQYDAVKDLRKMRKNRRCASEYKKRKQMEVDEILEENRRLREENKHLREENMFLVNPFNLESIPEEPIPYGVFPF